MDDRCDGRTYYDEKSSPFLKIITINFLVLTLVKDGKFNQTVDSKQTCSSKTIASLQKPRDLMYSTTSALFQLKAFFGLLAMASGAGVDTFSFFTSSTTPSKIKQSLRLHKNENGEDSWISQVYRWQLINFCFFQEHGITS